MESYIQSEIRQIEEWEWILERPFFTIERKSLYGLHCFVTGLSLAKSDIFYKDNGEDFTLWLSNELMGQVNNSFQHALLEANDDDEKAFDIWAGWFKTYKAKKKVEAESAFDLQEEINKEIDQEIIADLKKYQKEDEQNAIEILLAAIQNAIANNVPFPELKKEQNDSNT